MESNKNRKNGKKRGFHLYEHPWISLVAVIVTSILSIILVSNVTYDYFKLPENKPWVQFAQGMAYHALIIFIFVPFVLRLPKGKRTFRQYLEDIGLTRMQPFLQLILLALSCYLILAISQATASFVYRLAEGHPITPSFIRNVFNLSGDLPPYSPSLLVSIPSMFEEVAFRGVILTVFLSKYSERKSIIFSSLGFGLIHLINLASGRETIWVLGQVVWAFILGLFYGYVFVKTRSLLPPMIVHYLGNAFIFSFTKYLQANASIEIQTLYGVIFSLGLGPVAGMILWTRFFVSRWLHDPVPNTALSQTSDHSSSL